MNNRFYLTGEEDCVYLENKKERKIFTSLTGVNSAQDFNLLTQKGFRRSQNMAYIPACEACSACKSTRIIVADFKPSKSQKRVFAKNKNIHRKICSTQPTAEQYELFEKYIAARHNGGDMSDMGIDDYIKMVEETPVNSRLFEYYNEQSLVAVVLTDILERGVSMVYSFFEPELIGNSLGKFLILDHVDYAREQQLPYVYLGFSIKGAKNMEYKERFKPQEQFDGDDWVRV